MTVVTRLRPAEITPREWDIRCDLAVLYRAFVRYGWTDLIYTHISARLPDEPERYLINPYGLLFEEITASNLIVVDYDGNLVRGDWPVNTAGHAIHHAVLKARDDVNWVAAQPHACRHGGLLHEMRPAADHPAGDVHSWARGLPPLGCPDRGTP